MSTPRFLRTAAVCCLLLLPLRLFAVGEEARYQFNIRAQPLSQGLIQFSHQSGLAIVFPDPLVRGASAPEVRGAMSAADALDRLTADTDLTWRLIDERIIAVYGRRCETEGACPPPEELLRRHPLYVPGIEELYVYGSLVTGSRIKRNHITGSAPVDILSAPDIELSGAQTVGAILRYVPAVSGDATSTAISNGGDGTEAVTLRGLPPSGTLVLINGRRVANDGLAGESVDLNSIAPAAVERIEILKDGASAIYGSDAIAGVVNIIMKEDFYGLLAEHFRGVSQHGDGEIDTTTVQYGTGFRHGSLFLSASRMRQQEISARNRAVSRNADGRSRSGADLRSSATPGARVTLPGGDTVIYDEESGGYRAARPDDRFNHLDYTSSLVPFERLFLYGSATYDVTELLTVSLEGSYTDTDASARLAPVPLFTAFEREPIVVAADNLYNPFGEDILDVRRRLLELAPRDQHNTSDVTRFTALVEGLHQGWDWEAAYSYSRSKAGQTLTGLIDAERLRRAVGPAANCRGPAVDGCVPVNLFGPPGSLDEAQRDYLRAIDDTRGESRLDTYSLNASRKLWDLPGGVVDFAFGLEYRKESIEQRPGGPGVGIKTIGGADIERTRGRREVREIYAESIIPLWDSRDRNQSVDLEAAMRWSDYSDFGVTTNPKFGLRWQLSPDWLLRWTYSGGFRAPTLNELFQGAREGQAFIADPCTLQQNVGVLPGCTQLADPSRRQFLTVTGGNPDLEEENARTWGAGAVWTPDYAPGLLVSMDYYDIDTENVVDSSAQFIVNQNAATGRFAGQVSRDARGNLRLVSATHLNVGERRVKGVDIAVDYQLPVRIWGQWSTALNLSYVDEYSIRLGANAPTVDLAGAFVDPASDGLGGIPRWKGNLGIQWARQRWRGSYDLHFVSRLQETVPLSNRRRHIDNWMVHDLQLSYVFNLFNGLRLSMGVDNLMDAEAPFAASAFNDNIDGRTHDLRGRFWYARLSQRI